MKRKIVIKTLVVLGLAVGLSLAATAEEMEEVTMEFSGEVLKVDGNTVVVNMLPDGPVRTFTAKPGRTATIDGETITVDQLEVGTVLTAKATFVPSPEMVTEVSGTVMHVVSRTVIVRLDSGEVKQYTVDPDFTFTVQGEPKTIFDLRPGTQLTATRVRADPAVVITPETPITGTSPD